jgi:hypothetical protein
VLKDYGTAKGRKVSASHADKASLFEESSDSDLFSNHSEEHEGSIEKYIDQVMLMLQGTASGIKEEVLDTDSLI